MEAYSRMVKFAKVLTGVIMVLLLFLAVVFNGVVISAQQIEFSAAPATGQPELFERLLETAQRDDMGGNLYSRPTSSRPDDYRLISIKVEARNAGVLPAEWLQLQLSPKSGDVALFPEAAFDLAPFGARRVIQATLLCTGDAETGARDIRLSYYIFGRPMEVAVSKE